MGKRKAKPTARYLAWYGLLEEQNVCRDIDKEQHSTRREIQLYQCSLTLKTSPVFFRCFIQTHSFNTNRSACDCIIHSRWLRPLVTGAQNHVAYFAVMQAAVDAPASTCSVTATRGGVVIC